ncbi:MAG: hypothetical protein QOE03_485, partial [Micromonosporaceae bacterium]|nr:hypothetical protein [Micromonosporaceae bacterium]
MTAAAVDGGYWLTAVLGTVVAVLTIAAAILDAIVAHARADHPDEACGLVVGPV